NNSFLTSLLIFVRFRPLTRMKYLLTFLTLTILHISTLAHDGGHGQLEIWIVNDTPLKAEYIKYEDDQVYMINSNHDWISFDLAVLSPKHQELVLARHAQAVYINSGKSTHVDQSITIYGYTGAIILLMLSTLVYLKHKKRHHLAYGLIGVLMAVITACGGDDDDPVPADDDNMVDETPIDEDPPVMEEPPASDEIPANDPTFMNTLFGQFANITTESDDDWFYVAGNGLPLHDMMVGITNWQQQVPIDQDFTGDNRWQIPLQPVVAETPQPMENEFFRNAIAISINGIPLYHPMTNAGVDAFASGQLDQWGGHSGRADDYHYHLPPNHLQAMAGAGNPIAYALDGFPIHGETAEELDANLGRYNEEGGYQYHTVTEYPYFMANLVGEATLTETQDGQNTVYEIIPQPRTEGARPSTDPLGGNLEITDFETPSENNYSLTYTLDGETYIINYGWNDSGMYTYEFIDPSGNSTVETYQRQ
ncbi:MAG: YHYH protein, partial [Bacteroidota bacterium]